jgi:uracil-DNA glycosylase
VTVDDLPAAFATLPSAWRAALPGWTEAQQSRLIDAIRAASGTRPIAPADPFRALQLVSPAQARVVVFGQDPYPGAGHADGLAFSAPTSGRPSLRRIFDVLEADKPGWKRPSSGRLDAWAEQGVLLLNPTLTVEVGRVNSHTQLGWQALTSQIVQSLALRTEPPVFLLWGSQAAAFFEAALPSHVADVVTRLTTRHPSNDFKRGFMAEGSHFVATAARVDWWQLKDPLG